MIIRPHDNDSTGPSTHNILEPDGNAPLSSPEDAYAPGSVSGPDGGAMDAAAGAAGGRTASPGGADGGRMAFPAGANPEVLQEATPYDTIWAGEEVPEQERVGIERVMLAEDKLFVVLAVVLIIWIGLAIMIFRTDRRIDRLERKLDERIPNETADI